MPATSANVTFVVPPSTRRARERPKLPSALICPPPARRANQMNSPTSRITGPKPRIRLISAPRPGLTGSAEISTCFSCSLASSSSPLAKIGISVSKFFVDSASLSSGGYLMALSSSPEIVAPVEETLATLPLSTCERNSGL